MPKSAILQPGSQPDSATFYTRGEKGYLDYPALAKV
ncbi:hypothetical protein LEP3755_59260 [Leptolyngbya sp. NIES-3755]|nr:hypothetical protein LEP3755_59260 [Leptolyngbya sp. NIES-3755]